MINEQAYHDLIAKWKEDHSTSLQMIKSLLVSQGHCHCNDIEYIGSANSYCRTKPREFIKGHWYPCLMLYEEKGFGQPMIFDGNGFLVSKNSSNTYKESAFSFIGESLGDIKFSE